MRQVWFLLESEIFEGAKKRIQWHRENVKDGYFDEYWVTHDRLEALHAASRRRIKENVERNFKKGKGKFEINPTTNKKWKTGEKCPKRGYFRAYQKYVKKDGYFNMVFYKNFELYEKQRIRMTLSGIPKKCRDNSLPYDLDLDYILGIFPKDYAYPITNGNRSMGIFQPKIYALNKRLEISTHPILFFIKPVLA